MSSSSSGATVKLDYIISAKELIKPGLGTCRPWRQMFELRCLGIPRSIHEAAARVKKNIGYFQMNYAIVFLLVHPISLIVFVVMMAVCTFLYFLRD